MRYSTNQDIQTSQKDITLVACDTLYETEEGFEFNSILYCCNQIKVVCCAAAVELQNYSPKPFALHDTDMKSNF